MGLFFFLFSFCFNLGASRNPPSTLTMVRLLAPLAEEGAPAKLTVVFFFPYPGSYSGSAPPPFTSGGCPPVCEVFSEFLFVLPSPSQTTLCFFLWQASPRKFARSGALPMNAFRRLFFFFFPVLCCHFGHPSPPPCSAAEDRRAPPLLCDF